MEYVTCTNILQTQRVNVDDMLVFYDTTCQQRVDGIMKVCNANFGLVVGGYNENVIMRDERILSSVVKLNDYYLRNAIMIKGGLLCVMRLVVVSLVA